eukprot:4922624-Pyramimonas_sp.AAC.1
MADRGAVKEWLGKKKGVAPDGALIGRGPDKTGRLETRVNVVADVEVNGDHFGYDGGSMPGTTGRWVYSGSMLGRATSGRVATI